MALSRDKLGKPIELEDILNLINESITTDNLKVTGDCDIQGNVTINTLGTENKVYGAVFN